MIFDYISAVLVVETGLDQSNNINTTLASLAFDSVEGSLA
jgi:hypothetical protein